MIDNRDEIPGLAQPAAPAQNLRNPDFFATSETTLDPGEKELLARVQDAVNDSRYELPHLPSTHLTLLELTADPEADVVKVERMLSTDTVLAATLLRTANSALYGGSRKIDSMRGAILRIGLRGLRSLLYGQAMKSVIFRSKGLNAYAQEIWRQSCSVAAASRALAQHLHLDPDKTYLLGLLHDLGKVPLLAILRREAPDNFPFRPALVGTAFARHHQDVGCRLAATWDLPDEIVKVAGCHHEFWNNQDHPRSAALVNLAHRADLCLSSEPDTTLDTLAADRTWENLELGPDLRGPALHSIAGTCRALESDPPF